MKKIVLTGGGTAGHVTPNIALLPSLKEAGYEVFYIGSYTGIEKTLIEDLGIPYYGISSGKLRRYRSLKNLSDPFRVLHGLFQAKRLMKKIKPDIVFSKQFLQVLLSDRSFCLAIKQPDLTFAISQLTNLLFSLLAEALVLSM